jgi:flagellar assembly protein FliH
MTQPAPHKPFSFATEFTPEGEVLSGPAQSYFSRDEAARLAEKARTEGAAQAKAAGFANVDRIVSSLSPVAVQLAKIAEELRREAAELALIAARKIAGDALDANGAKLAAEAIADAVRLLKVNPTVTVAATPDSLMEIQIRMEQLKRQSGPLAITFIADPAARPGDWRVQWSEGVIGFSREDVEAAIDNAVRARLDDPVEPQLELFSA